MTQYNSLNVKLSNSQRNKLKSAIKNETEVVLRLSLKKLYGPFLWMGFNCLKARATSRRQFTFYH